MREGARDVEGETQRALAVDDRRAAAVQDAVEGEGQVLEDDARVLGRGAVAQELDAVRVPEILRGHHLAAELGERALAVVRVEPALDRDGGAAPQRAVHDAEPASAHPVAQVELVERGLQRARGGRRAPRASGPFAEASPPPREGARARPWPGRARGASADGVKEKTGAPDGPSLRGAFGFWAGRRFLLTSLPYIFTTFGSRGGGTTSRKSTFGVASFGCRGAIRARHNQVRRRRDTRSA